MNSSSPSNYNLRDCEELLVERGLFSDLCSDGLELSVSFVHTDSEEGRKLNITLSD